MRIARAALALILFVGSSLIWTSAARAHCQVPCGIYGDWARVQNLMEDAGTIAKAVTEMERLAGQQDPQSLNQMVRWIKTKEDHANHIISVMSEYFLCQRVQAAAPESSQFEAYRQKLVDHHAVMTAAMKTKQEASAAAAAVLKQALEKVAPYYQPTK